MKFIDPRIDFAFKKIFGSEDAKDILISFLESLLGLEGDKRLKSITIINPYFPGGHGSGIYANCKKKHYR